MGSEADDVQKLPRLGSEPLQLPTFDERTSLIAANAAYYSAVRRKDADLMEQLLDDDCTMGNSTITRVARNRTRGTFGIIVRIQPHRGIRTSSSSTTSKCSLTRRTSAASSSRSATRPTGARRATTTARRRVR